MPAIYNGMPSSHLVHQVWRKSRHGNPSGNRVEIAVLPDGRVALRDSRRTGGPAPIVPRRHTAAFLRSAKEGEFHRPPTEMISPLARADGTGIVNVA